MQLSACIQSLTLLNELICLLFLTKTNGLNEDLNQNILICFCKSNILHFGMIFASVFYV